MIFLLVWGRGSRCDDPHLGKPYSHTEHWEVYIAVSLTRGKEKKWLHPDGAADCPQISPLSLPPTSSARPVPQWSDMEAITAVSRGAYHMGTMKSCLFQPELIQEAGRFNDFSRKRPLQSFTISHLLYKLHRFKEGCCQCGLWDVLEMHSSSFVFHFTWTRMHISDAWELNVPVKDVSFCFNARFLRRLVFLPAD